MAEKQLKTIKFPGLPDTYVIPEGGNIDIDLEGSVEGAATPVNADTLGGFAADEYAKKSDIGDNGAIELNYSIVGETEEPTEPTENMIWVNTESKITSHIFSKNEPKNPAEGMVWITLGDNSNVAFYSFNINGIGFDEIYPLSVKQYIDDTWVDKIAKSYQNGEWVDWIFCVFLPNGEYITGWTQAILNGGGYSFDGEGHLVLTKAAGNGSAGTGTVLLSPVYDLSKCNTLKVRMKASNTSSGDGILIGVRSSVVSDYWNAYNAQWSVKAECIKTTDFTEFTCDISQISSGCIAIEISGLAAA